MIQILIKRPAGLATIPNQHRPRQAEYVILVDKKRGPQFVILPTLLILLTQIKLFYRDWLIDTYF